MMNAMLKRIRSAPLSRLIIIGIVLLGLFLRVLNVNWDKNQHLHPDERFLTMVMGNMTIPSSLSIYLNPDQSTFNPVNIGHAFYVYGTLPLVINKLIAVWLHFDDYNNLTLLGRWLSAIVDSFSIVLVILIAKKFEQRYHFHRNVKYFAGLFYAFSVLSIQQAHFFTVDTFASTFLLGSLYAAVRVNKEHFIRSSLLSGMLMGLAVASKINVILGAPLVGWLLVEPTILYAMEHRKKWLAFSSVFVHSLLWLLSFWIVLRLAAPYYFARFSVVDLHLNTAFVGNVSQLASFSDPNGYFPPGIQWYSKIPVIFPLENIAIFGLGLPLFFLTVFGFGKLIFWGFAHVKQRLGLMAILVWMLALFFYQGVQYVTTLRYFLPLFPFYAIVSAFGLLELAKNIAKKGTLRTSGHEKLVACIVVVCLLWPLMFVSVYLHPNTRVEASKWIYKVLPDNSTVALEHWDDPLPLQVPNANPDNKSIVGKQLPVFYPDDEVKWKEMSQVLNESDYYILTSNRGWGSIMDAPDKYPRMSQFYTDLFAGKTQFEKIAEFSSYPSLSYLGLPITLNDDWAEEAFTVYDHPKVIIFAKKGERR